MLEAKASQFSLSPEGEILWQEKINSPLPGVAVAVLDKGTHALKPVIRVLENEHTKQYDQVGIENSLKIWLKTYLSEVLESLVLLEVPEGAAVKDDPVSKIAEVAYNQLGIVPRDQLESFIADLTTETRADLRAKKIRLGPVLVFMPELNKPAAVKTRALLWSIYNDKDLPAKVPADGIVSTKIEDENPCKDYYRSIGYPLYGGRAVRIDMLDRVINCIYDNATGGKFQARHEMAEWLGCSIDDLYKVIEDMGHVKIYDPLDHIQEEENKPSEEAQQQENSVATDEATEEKPAEAQEAAPAKPELATFRLKKGKASDTAGSKPQKKKKFDDGKKPSNKKKDGKKKPKKDKGPRVISIDAKVNEEDSPFAILQQLKK